MKNNNYNIFLHLLKGIKSFFSQDLWLKLFSLAAAVFMWFIVMNIINPTEIKNFTVPVSFENMENLTNQGYIVSNFEDFEDVNVSIKVEATRPALDALSKSENRSKISAKIDLSKIEINNNNDYPKKYTVGVVPSLPNGLYTYNFDIASYYPSIFEVEIDKSATKSVPVELKTYGSPSSGYVERSPSSVIKNVQVTGPQNKILSAEKVVATIDITGAKSKVQSNCQMKLYDEDNNLIEGFVIEPKTIPVSVEIRKSGTVEIEKPRTIGRLPDHLELLSVEWEPKSINVTSIGNNNIENITLQPIDLTGIRGDTTEVIDISKELENAGLEPLENQNNVTVTIKVGVLSAEKYVIKPEKINVIGLNTGLDAAINDDLVVEIGGAKNIDVNTLMPVIDITGLGEGKHTVPVKLNLPENAILNGDAEIDVNLTRKSMISGNNTVTEDISESVSESTTRSEEETESNTINENP